MNLKKKLALWEKEKLISAFQSQTILEFEQRTNRPTFFISVILLSVFCIGLGIISMVSANWQEIPAWLKLCCDFVLLIGSAYGIFYYRDSDKSWIKEGLILFYALLILGSIGLVAQIYQLQSVDLRAYFVWSVLVIPLLFMSQKIVLPFVWFPVFFTSSIDMLDNTVWFRDMIYFTNKVYPAAPWIFFTIMLAYLYFLFKILLGKYVPQIRKALKFWMMIWIPLIIMMLDFRVSHWTARTEDITSFTIILFLCILLIGGLYYIARRFKQAYLLPSVITMILFFSAIFVFLPLHATHTLILGSLLSFISIGWLLAYAYNYSRPRLMNLAVILCALRFFIVFIQKFGSLLSTGFGLIVTGVLFIILAYGVRKFINRHQTDSIETKAKKTLPKTKSSKGAKK